MGLLFATLAILLLASVIAGCGGERRPNIVLIVVDTLRADHLGAYGYTRPTSPEIDRLLAARGVRVERAMVQAPWTLPSMASMLTGLEPERLLDAKGEPWGIPEEAETLAERLQANGYQTAAVVANPTLHQGNGYAQGFDHFWSAPYELASMSKHADEVDREARKLLATAEGSGKPYFLYLHYLDPHDPYDNADIVEGRSPFLPGYRGALRGTDVHGLYAGALKLADPVADREQLVALYDAEIRYVDRFIGQLLESLDLENTLVVLTADHGEELLDHGGYKHGETLYQEQLHVPLILRWDGVLPAGANLPATVPLLDLWPTLVAAADAAEADDAPLGHDLLPHLRDLSPPPARPIFARHLARGPLRAARLEGERKDIVFDRHGAHQPVDDADRAIWQRDVARLEPVERYDLGRDPGEKSGLPTADQIPWALFDQLDRQLAGLRLFSSGLPAGQTLSARLELDGPIRSVRPLFLGPADSWRLEGSTLSFVLQGEGRAKFLLIEGDFREVRALTLDHAGLAGPGGKILRLPATLRDLLVHPDQIAPTPLESPTLQLWIRRPLPTLGNGEKDPETIRRLKALGYAG